MFDRGDGPAGEGQFPLGRVVATPAALQACADGHIDPVAILIRHSSGDWGELCDEDKHANERALVNGARILSAYEHDNVKLWVITEADRSSTCILLPDEY